MEKLYLDLVPVSGVSAAHRRTTQKIMELTGENLGNLVFRHALHLVVDGFRDYRPVRYEEAMVAAQKGPVERVLVSCANWLGSRDQDEAANANRVRAFEAIDAPTVCFGLGVQAGHDEAETTLRPNAERLAKILSERGKALSVRDSHTQDALERVGITNTVVTGCPSNFINLVPTLGASIAAKARALMDTDPTWTDLRMAISEVSGGHPLSGAVTKSHLKLMDSAPAFYLIQAPVLMPFVLGETDEVPRPYAGGANPFEDLKEVARVLRAKTLHFSTVPGWLDFSRTCHLSFGMRIHGTMVPLQAGVPSLLIGHDSRTSGLASHMGIPALSPKAFLEATQTTPKPLFEAISTTMDGYDARRNALAKVMVDYLATNALAPPPALKALSEDPAVAETAQP